MNHFRDTLSFFSRIRYLLWRSLGARDTITLRLKSGLLINIRSQSTTDYGVAWDIFFRGAYRSLDPIYQVKQIVDLGANVGYSCLFWCQQYPDARITAFEPHPVHVNAINEHLFQNQLLDRVRVLGVAAGVAEGTAYLVDAGSSSVLTSSASGYAVSVVDVFKMLDFTIDILKIDIEGGEYALLNDERFGTLMVRVVIVEWHQTPAFPDGRTWCEERLRKFGYRTSNGIEDLPLAGLIWGFRQD